MAEFSKIAWTTHTYNPWWGCTKVSPGCAFCYAASLDSRYFPDEVHWGAGVARKTMSEQNWNKPLKWEREAVKSGERPLVFCASMADVFDVEAPPGARDRLYNLVKRTPHLIWLFLTKRPENVLEMLPADWGNGYPNVWMGTTTENQEMADKRIPLLGKIPAKLRFLSVEPQIENIDFSRWLSSNLSRTPSFEWMIFGGESEAPSKARPFDPEWVKAPMEMAKEWGVATFVKQMGTKWASANGIDRKGDDPAEWPEWLRVREFPKARYEKVEA